jgi:hypothetical protein
MFSSFSFSRAKALLKKTEAAAILLLILLALLGGCGADTEDIDDTNYPGTLPPGLAGEWANSQGETYKIESNSGDVYTFEYISDYDGIYEGVSWIMSYKGTICFVSNYSTNSGVVIIEYSIKPDYPGYNDNSFFAIYYQNMTSHSVQLANVITLLDYSCPDTATLQEAIAKFTLGKKGLYVSQWSSLTK